MKFYMPDLGETEEDARLIPGCDGNWSPELFVTDAAEHYYTHMDGWESKWPVTIAVIDQHGVETRWKVECEAVPSFFASKVEAEGDNP